MSDCGSSWRASDAVGFPLERSPVEEARTTDDDLNDWTGYGPIIG
jgi:hypothetical protein